MRLLGRDFHTPYKSVLFPSPTDARSYKTTVLKKISCINYPALSLSLRQRDQNKKKSYPLVGSQVVYTIILRTCFSMIMFRILSMVEL